MYEPLSSTLQNITAAILAGGLGVRLRALTGDRPKVLAEFSGKPVLAYLLEQAAAAGVRKAVLCTGYGADAVREVVGERYGPLEIAYSVEKEPLGTGGALRLALPCFASRQVLVMNGDSYCSAELEAFDRFHAGSGAQASLVLAHVESAARFGRVEFDESGAVTKFLEKDALEAPGWINAGIYMLSRALIESIPEGREVSLEREIFPALIGRGLYCRPTDGRFIDIGTPESYGGAEAFFAREALR